MKIAVGSDHAGFDGKKGVVSALAAAGNEVVDMGCRSAESCDYPDYARLVAKAVSKGDADRGVLLCGTGIGMAIAANKLPGVRAAACWSEESARMAAAHNDLNVLCLSSRLFDAKQVEKILRAWLETKFEGGRHARRLAKIAAIEKECGQ